MCFSIYFQIISRYIYFISFANTAKILAIHGTIQAIIYRNTLINYEYILKYIEVNALEHILW